MTDITVLITTTETTLNEVANQAAGLATGLQNVAPGDAINSPNKSILYLTEIAQKLQELSAKCKTIGEISSEAKR